MQDALVLKSAGCILDWTAVFLFAYFLKLSLDSKMRPKEAGLGVPLRLVQGIKKSRLLQEAIELFTEDREMLL